MTLLLWIVSGHPCGVMGLWGRALLLHRLVDGWPLHVPTMFATYIIVGFHKTATLVGWRYIGDIPELYHRLP